MKIHARRASLMIAFFILVPALAMSAEGPPKEAALPAAVAPPPAGKGAAFNATPADLKALGYVEEEFIVSGKANVYEYGPDGAVQIKTPNMPYATRILLRRPTDRRRFSGTVRVETSHPQYGIDFVWSRTTDYVIANGDAVVSIAMRRGEYSPIEAMRGFDPVRYGALNFTESGQNWDIIGQVGRLLKTQGPDNPLKGYDVKRLYAQGWSGGGALLLIYISDGFAEKARMPDGSPIYDGYLVGEPSGYPKINAAAPALPTSDPREKVQPIDVPVISLDTRPQEPYRRRPDGNRPHDRYRVYEVAGAGHNNLRLPLIYKDSVDAGQGAGCAYEVSRFPMFHFFKSTLARLDAWAAKGVTPPPSQRITLQADGTPQLDENGNPVGGVRSSYLDVPVARYFTNAPKAGGGSRACALDGAQEKFPAEKLTKLYRTHKGYVDKVDSRVAALERDGWVLPADAEELRQEAQQFGGL
jgi:Alpha/beta hydrolase domain